jgi:hypothetical protein
MENSAPWHGVQKSTSYAPSGMNTQAEYWDMPQPITSGQSSLSKHYRRQPLPENMTAQEQYFIPIAVLNSHPGLSLTNARN